MTCTKNSTLLFMFLFYKSFLWSIQLLYTNTSTTHGTLQAWNIHTTCVEWYPPCLAIEKAGTRKTCTAADANIIPWDLGQSNRLEKAAVFGLWYYSSVLPSTSSSRGNAEFAGLEHDGTGRKLEEPLLRIHKLEYPLLQEDITFPWKILALIGSIQHFGYFAVRNSSSRWDLWDFSLLYHR